MSKILVTGAAGFMGSHLFDYLVKEGHFVFGLDNYSIGTYRHENIVQCDLTDKEETERIVSLIKPEIVYHLAAWAHEGLSQFCPIRITENNYNAHLNLFVTCIKHKVKRYVVTSSMSVYGNQQPPFSEDMKQEPVDIYAIAKMAVEESTKILGTVHGIEYVIIRPHNVYGPRQVLHDPYRNVVAIFINRLLKGKALYIYGDGEQKRSFSYIDDITPVIAKAGFAAVNGETINAGPLEECSINQLAAEVKKYFPDSLPSINLADRPLEVKYAWCTNDKAKELLDYKTKTTFEEGIRKMVAWAKKVGYQKPKYLEELELVTDTTPLPWIKHE